MNTKNNRRAQTTDEAIVREVYAIIWAEHRPISKITVREICERAGINRSTFYAHYQDIFDVAEQVEKTMAKMHYDRLNIIFLEGGNFRSVMESVFDFVQEYRQFFQLYFREISRASYLVETLNLPFQKQVQKLQEADQGHGIPREGAYHYHFFTAGVTSLLTTWLDRNCKETPAQLYEILEREYGPDSLFRIWSGAANR